MNREAPWHVVKGLHEIDAKADVRWDDMMHNWFLYWDGQRICGLFHRDGSNMLELVLDEIRDLLDTSDNFKDGPDRVRRMRRRAEEARSRAELRKELMIEESIRESERMFRRHASGAPVMA